LLNEASLTEFKATSLAFLVG